MYKHYIRLNEAGTIVYGFSSVFEEPQEGDICINEDSERHFQTTLTGPNGIYIYKYVDDQIVLRTLEEIEADISVLPPTPLTTQEQLDQLKIAFGDYVLFGGI